MTFYKQYKEEFYNLFQKIRLGCPESDDQKTKVRQIVSYLNIIDSQIRPLSQKRQLVFVDCAAGNCYLSFLIYYYYSVLKNRDIIIHCIDTNAELMNNNAETAGYLGFNQLFFHTGDILSFDQCNNADLVYSLHACDEATDKTLYLGHSLNARAIFSVSCCQHTIRRNIKMNALKGVSRYKSFSEKIAYYVADSMRGHLLEMNGYKVDIFDFTSVRNTDKNIMLRARKNNNPKNLNLKTEYDYLKTQFNVAPYLEKLLTAK